MQRKINYTKVKKQSLITIGGKNDALIFINYL